MSKPLIIVFLFAVNIGLAQPGHENMPVSQRPEQAWWNLLHYVIDISPDYASKSLIGTNSIKFRALSAGQVLQLDLQQPMSIYSVIWKKDTLQLERKGDAYIVRFPEEIKVNELVTITVSFGGQPKVAVHPPWDGGWIWSKDKMGRPWMSLACESPGAKLWLPCKNVLYDEPDSGVDLNITVPDTLVGVGNGRLVKQTRHGDGTATFSWSVSNPINNYNICPYIGKYVTWHHNYAGLKGNLDCDYWVLDYNYEKAARHLTEVDTMLDCFEDWMGPYPFYQDSYKVVESPMLGMEHQSAIAYGNGFENGYGNKNLSGTQWGSKWDFVLIHESGHEWFGNSITSNSYIDSWIHEGFTKYLETLYTTYLCGNAAGDEYTKGIWKRIKNDAPVIGSGSSDEYNKGCALLHMIRQIVGDTSFKKILHDLNTSFFHQTVNTDQILHCMNRSAARDFSTLFAQYLTTTRIPALEYYFEGESLWYHWTNCVNGFNMPVKVAIGDGDEFFIAPETQWKKTSISQALTKRLHINSNFYVSALERMPSGASVSVFNPFSHRHEYLPDRTGGTAIAPVYTGALFFKRQSQRSIEEQLRDDLAFSDLEQSNLF
jgi:aminopeptidase N